MSIVKNTKKLLYLFSFYWKYAKGFFVVSLIIELTIIPVSTFFNLNIIRVAVDSLADGAPFSDLTKIISLYLIVIMVLKSLYDIYIQYSAPVNARVADRIKKSIYEKVLSTDYKYIDDPKYFDNYYWTIDEFSDYVISARNSLVSFVIACSNIAVIISMMSTVSLGLSIIIIISIVISTILSIPKNKMSYEFDRKMILPNRRIGYIHKIFYLKDYAADIRCNKSGDFALTDYSMASKERYNIIKDFAKKKIIFSLFDNAIVNLTNLFIMLYLAYDIVFNNLSIGNFSVLFSACWTLRGSLSDIISVFITAQKYSYYVDTLKVFMNSESEIEFRNKNNKYIHIEKGTPFEIDINSACFKYSNSKFEIKNLELHISAGQKVAIVGENGSGKSTLIKLLLRLYDFDSGSYLINKVNIKQYDIKDLRLSIGIAFQRPTIYSFSLKDNMRLYRNMNDSQINDALELMDLTQVLAKSGGTINSYISKEFSDDGIELSGGEEQKLGLARICKGDFGLLLLDEPSSMLDPFAEANLNRIIWDKSNKATTIVISHRLSNVVDADYIFFMQGGQIIEKGTHRELMQQKGQYFKMFETQAKEYLR